MPRTRSITYIRSGTTPTLLLTYKKKDFEADPVVFYDDSKITAVNVEVRDTDTGGVLLASSPMTYVANLDGYKLKWTYAAALDNVRSITVRFMPTLAVGVPSALAPMESEEYDLADILETISAQGDVLSILSDVLGSSVTGYTLLAPQEVSVPVTGGDPNDYPLRFLLHDVTGTSPVALDDPDGDITLIAEDLAGNPITGLSFIHTGAPVMEVEGVGDRSGQLRVEDTFPVGVNLIVLRATGAYEGVTINATRLIVPVREDIHQNILDAVLDLQGAGFDTATDSNVQLRILLNNILTKVNSISSTGNAALSGPTEFEIPSIGTHDETYVLTIRDDNGDLVDATVGPTADMLPDVPSGVTIASITRTSLGTYEIVVRVASTTTDRTFRTLRLNWEVAGVADQATKEVLFTTAPGTLTAIFDAVFDNVFGLEAHETSELARYMDLSTDIVEHRQEVEPELDALTTNLATVDGVVDEILARIGDLLDLDGDGPTETVMEALRLIYDAQTPNALGGRFGEESID